MAWMKLDLDFFHDPKVRLLVARHGEGAAWRWLELAALASDQRGALDLSGEMMRRWAEDETGLRGKRLTAAVEKCVECGLFDREPWEKSRILTSRRLEKDAKTRWNTSRSRRISAKKSWDSRRENEG